jgi:ABC-type phosphate/phosphonate transport system substrate-binding protein
VPGETVRTPGTRPLVLGFYLGDSLRPIAATIAHELGDRIAIPVSFDMSMSDADRRLMVDGGSADVWWLCGLETLVAQDGGSGLEIVAAPVFPGQPGPTYHSVVVASGSARVSSLDDLTGSVLAINEPRSWSGNHALRALLAERGTGAPLFREVMVTGGHEASIDAVVAGTADLAAIDHTVWADRTARDPATATLRVLGRTPDWPAPPFSVSGALDRGLARALRDALVEMRPSGLDAIVAASERDYEPLRDGLAASRTLAW